jgi:hypothetical protein
MSLGSRAGIVFGNAILLVPVFVLLIVSAIMTSISAANINKLPDTSQIYRYTRNITVTLWVLFGASIVFMFTIGILVLPMLVAYPYLYGFIMILFAILNISLAGILFYVSTKVKSNPKYNTDEGQKAYKNSLIPAILMLSAGIFMFIYSVYSIYKYRKLGGMTADMQLVSQFVAPEFAAPLQYAFPAQPGQPVYDTSGLQQWYNNYKQT